jgi:glycerol-3-phosphate acyltransferase PlsY
MRNNLTKTVAAVIGLALLAAVAAWQFYVFVTFTDVKGVADVQGGRVHLWIAIAIALVTCIAAVFLISKSLLYDRRNEIHITSQGHPLGVGRSTEGSL